ncbi:MAG: MurR/RpiR family transcriptional regulator [Lachnospiraceae bacterium]
MEPRIRAKIQGVYTGLRPSEKKAADYFLHYHQSMEKLRIEDVAKKAEVSQPTILRFLKALGYQGFKEFKYALIQEEAREEQKEEDAIELYGFRLSKKDMLEQIPGKVIATSIQMLEETLKSVQVKEYKRAVEAILKAESIVIYSVENSVCTANDLLTKLMYLGLNCRMYEDYYLQSISAKNLTKQDLAIGISYSGYSRDTVEMMRLARAAGAATLVLTNFENAMIADYADILLCASHHQFLYGDTIFSRITQLALVDMLYAGVINQNYEKLSKQLKQNSKIIAQRAYPEEEKEI